jgi:hypothetical protein
VAGAQRRWLAHVLAYTLAGAFSSVLVGGALGALGGLVLPPAAVRLAGPVALMLGMAAVAVDMGWLRLRLAQPRRQTRDVWNYRFGALAASTLWGFDLGLVVTTWFTFAGVWVLLATAFLVQDPVLGSALLLAYWLGRAASVWIGPLLLEDAGQTPWMLDEINNRRRSFRSISLLGVGLLLSALLLFRGL